MIPADHSRRSFLKTSVALAGSTTVMNGLLQAQTKDAGLLFAYVGTFSAPLTDMLPTQVDLPPGNGRGIHIFQVNLDDPRFILNPEDHATPCAGTGMGVATFPREHVVSRRELEENAFPQGERALEAIA